MVFAQKIFWLYERPKACHFAHIHCKCVFLTLASMLERKGVGDGGWEREVVSITADRTCRAFCGSDAASPFFTLHTNTADSCYTCAGIVPDKPKMQDTMHRRQPLDSSASGALHRIDTLFKKACQFSRCSSCAKSLPQRTTDASCSSSTGEASEHVQKNAGGRLCAPV